MPFTDQLDVKYHLKVRVVVHGAEIDGHVAQEEEINKEIDKNMYLCARGGDGVQPRGGDGPVLITGGHMGDGRLESHAAIGSDVNCGSCPAEGEGVGSAPRA